LHGISRIITDPFSSWDAELTEMVTGELLFFGGMGAMAVGIPIWAVNTSRRNKIEVALINFNTSSFLQNNKQTYFGFKQPSTFGLSVKINF
jgi:hypothetical protein